MESYINRRSFLKNSALTASAFTILSSSKSAFTYAANEKLNIALIGVAGRGSWFVGAIPNLKQNVVAMCDVNSRKASGAFNKFPDANKFSDFRRMFDQMDKDIDAVTVAVPDHNHAVITAAAMKHGKHVLTEKPLTHCINEARMLRKIAKDNKIASQMGNQGTASRGFRESVTIIQKGKLGKISEIYAWNTGGGAGERPRPADVHEIPEYINWDVWLGPAMDRDYNSRWIQWHTWRDFATGQLGNWGCHTMNVIFKGMKIDSLWYADDLPQEKRTIRITPQVSGTHDLTFPKWEILHYHIPPRKGLDKLTVKWHNGSGQAPLMREKVESLMNSRLDWGDAGEKRWADHAGCLLIGSEGMLKSNGHNTEYKLFPEDKFKDFQVPELILPKSRGHESEWLDACRGGQPAMSNFDYSGPLTEFALLGNIATRVNTEIIYDPVEMKILNNEKANELIRDPYRTGWSL